MNAYNVCTQYFSMLAISNHLLCYCFLPACLPACLPFLVVINFFVLVTCLSNYRLHNACEMEIQSSVKSFFVCVRVHSISPACVLGRSPLCVWPQTLLSPLLTFVRFLAISSISLNANKKRRRRRKELKHVCSGGDRIVNQGGD